MTGTELVAAISNEAMSTLVDAFKREAIDRWQSHRARVFLEGLADAWIKEEATGIETPRLDALLKKFKEEKTSEILFESYRKVCLSASKDLGPRIIALLTCKLLREERMADEFEEVMLNIAEHLRDRELREFANAFKASGERGIRKDMVTFTHGMARGLNQDSETILEFESTVPTRSLVKSLLNLGAGLDVSLDSVDAEYKVAIVIPKAMNELVEMIDRVTGPAT